MSRLKRRSARGRRAVVLVQALIVVAALVALIATLAANQRASLEAVQNDLRQRRMELAERAAVARAMTVLSTANTSLVTLNDDWAQLGDDGNTTYDLGNGTTFRMQIVDTSSLINVNTVTQAQLMELPLSEDEIAGLVDWRTTSTTATADGAKDETYNALQTPYNTKLGPLTTVSELLLIHGWIGHDLYSTDFTNVSSAGTPEDANGNPLPLIALLTANSGMPNTQASGTARINVSGARVTATTLQRAGLSGQLANQIAALPQNQRTSWSSLLRAVGGSTNNAQRLLNALTVKSGTRLQGLINLNTATQSVLQTVPNVTSDMATAIVSQQSAGFSTLGALTTVNGLSGAQLARVADSFGIGSDTFLVRIYAESGGNAQAYEVVVGIRAGAASTNTTSGTTTAIGTTGTAGTNAATASGPQVIALNRLTNPGIPAYWTWADQSDTTVDAGAQQTTGQTTTASSAGAGAAR